MKSLLPVRGQGHGRGGVDERKNASQQTAPFLRAPLLKRCLSASLALHVRWQLQRKRAKGAIAEVTQDALPSFLAVAEKEALRYFNDDIFSRALGWVHLVALLQYSDEAGASFITMINTSETRASSHRCSSTSAQLMPYLSVVHVM